MIKILLHIFLIVGLSQLNAQQIGYQSGTASANLIMPISIESGQGDLDFGDILLPGVPTKEEIDPLVGKEFIIKGQVGRNVSIIFNDVELTNYAWVSNHPSQDAGTLTFIPNVLAEKSIPVSSGDNIVLKQNGMIGEIKLQVGGSITLDAKQPEGDYEGLFIISVSY